MRRIFRTRRPKNFKLGNGRSLDLRKSPYNLPDNLPDEVSPWGDTGSASGVKWTTAVYEMTHLYAVSPDDV